MINTFGALIHAPSHQILATCIVAAKVRDQNPLSSILYTNKVVPTRLNVVCSKHFAVLVVHWNLTALH